MMKKVNLLIATILVTASIALAGDFRQFFYLYPTAYGDTMNAAGQGRMRERMGVQYLEVEAAANVPDGTTFRVVVNNGEDDFTAGVIVIEDSYGILRLTNSSNKKRVLSRGVFPITNIRLIRVVDEKGDILTADM
jgi:hypothetical protein